MTEVALPKDKPVGSQLASREDVAAAEQVYLRNACAFSERAILIIVGATVTVLAGFLSQVWGSVGIPFRTELAQSLTAFGRLFTACFCLPALRLFSLRPLYVSWWSIPPFLTWAVGALAAVIYYTTLLDRLGKAILKYAVIATP